MPKDTERTEPSGVVKKPYTSPRLLKHGDLRKLALGTAGKRADGKGKPASKK